MGFPRVRHGRRTSASSFVVPAFCGILLILLFTVVSCGNGGDTQASPVPSPVQIEPSPAVQESPSPEPSPLPSPKPSVKPSAKPSPSPSAQPSEKPSPSPSPSPSPLPSPSPSPKPSPTPSKPVTEWDVPDPTLSAPGGIGVRAVTLRITAPFVQAKMKYTLDGSEPSPDSGREYSAPLNIDKSAIVKVIAYVPNGKRSNVVTANYTVNEILVVPGGTGEGGIADPAGSINKAIASAKTYGIKTVRIAAGTYKEAVVVDTALQLRGAYLKDFSRQNISAGATIIQAPDSNQATTGDNPAFSLQVKGSAADATTLLDSLTIRGSFSSYSIALHVKDGAAPVIRSVRAEGAEGSTAVGLQADDSKPRIEYSYIAAGKGSTTQGLSLKRSPAEIYYSTVSAGEATATATGISAIGSAFTIASSVVDGGASTFSYGIGVYADSNADIQNVTVSNSGVSAAYGIYLSASKPKLRNLIIQTTGNRTAFAIYENVVDSNPQIIDGIAIAGNPKNGWYSDYESRTTFTGVDANGNFSVGGKSLQSPAATHVVELKSLVGAKPNLNTPADAPDGVKNGGTTLTGPAATDKNGKARTEPWSLGAYELD